MTKLGEHRKNQCMKICNMNNIVEGLNRFIEIERFKRNIITDGHLVLHKTVETNSLAKAYKNYIVSVWFVKGADKYKVVTVKYSMRAVGNIEDEIDKILSIELSKALFSLVTSDIMGGIINGDYTDSNE